MTFTLQKVIWFLILPPSSLIVLILLGLLLVNKRRRSGVFVIISAALMLYILSLGWTADMIIKPLEKANPPLKEEKINANAIVVLGGGSTDLEWIGANPVPNAESSARLITGIELARKLGIPIVLSMGNGEPFATKVNDADTMFSAAIRLGVPQKQIIVENRSRNTVENSHAVRKLLTGDRIILVTSAYHMKRAKAIFTKRGFTVIAAPAYFLGQTRKYTAVSLIPRSSELALSTTGIAEWISLLWWGIRGEM